MPYGSRRSGNPMRASGSPFLPLLQSPLYQERRAAIQQVQRQSPHGQGPRSVSPASLPMARLGCPSRMLLRRVLRVGFQSGCSNLVPCRSPVVRHNSSFKPTPAARLNSGVKNTVDKRRISQAKMPYSSKFTVTPNALNSNREQIVRINCTIRVAHCDSP